MGKKKGRKAYENTVLDIGGVMPFFSSVNSTRQLEETFNDVYLTEEQKKRDCEITKLFTYYVASYNDKRTSNPIYKNIILGICCAIIVAFSIAFLYLLLHVAGTVNTIKVNNVVALITVCITYLTLVIGILKIITEYVFPQKEEEYVTRIVKAIQKNDLKNKIENMKHGE